MEKFYILHYIELRRCFVFNVDSNYNLACFVCGPGVVSRRWRGTARQHQTLCHSLVWMLIDDFIIHSYIVTQSAGGHHSPDTPHSLVFTT